MKPFIRSNARYPSEAMKIDLNAILHKGVEAHQKGDLNAAAAHYQKILSVVPEHADANHLLGLVLFQAQETEKAGMLIRKAISIDEKIPLYHANLGRVLKADNQNDAAVLAFREAVRLEPQNPILHADLASAMIASGDVDGARARAHLALELSPDLPEGHLNLGLALQELRGPSDDEAMKCFRRAIDIKPDMAGAYLALGVGLHECGDSDGAIDNYQRALALDPRFVEAHTNLGNIYRLQNRFAEAEEHYRAAFSIRDDIADVWGNLGVTLHEQGRYEDALKAYDRAVELAPGSPEIRRNRGMVRLATGDFENGWKDYAYRWQTARFRALRRDWPVPEWTGEDVHGRNILVHAEQGLGDTIQFARYLRVLNDAGGRVHLECPAVLHPLFQDAAYLKSLFVPGDPLPNLDAHVPLLDLPGLLAPDYIASPYAERYLGVPSDGVKKWAGIADHWPPGKRVGIAWRGNPDHIRDDLRSPGLPAFGPLFDLEDTVLVSLQKDNAAEELAALPTGRRLIDPTDEIDDFGDTAALMMHLDAVVACDSAPLHLAGAMGVRTYAVLPHVAEWRWGVSGETTPWYPDMTLVRQQTDGDWGDVFDRVALEIRGS